MNGFRRSASVLARAACLTALLISPSHSSGLSDGYYLSTSQNSFDDVIADLQDAIINQGLVIDFTGHTRDMMERTAGALETESPLSDAHYLNFCSAQLTHAAVAADPENMAICPYVVFAYQNKDDPSTVYLGYRRPIGAPCTESEQALAQIEDLLKRLVDEAAD